MGTTEQFVDHDKTLNAQVDSYSNPVYLIDRSPDRLVQKYNAIHAEKQIIGSYAVGSRHCLVVFVNARVKKKVIRKKVTKDVING